MVRLLVISDTHDNLEAVDSLLQCIKKKKIPYDLVVHLGDIISPFTLRKLVNDFEGRLIAIFGNNDGDRSLLKSILPDITDPPVEKDLDGKLVLLLHGFKSSDMTEFVVNSLSLTGKYDIILYGHTHVARVINRDGTLVVNPGALSGYVSGKRTFAIVDTEKMEANIVDIDECLL